MASARTAWASSGVISGSGLAMAKMTGSRAMEATMAGVTAPFALTPRNTSAPRMASSSVRNSVSTAWADFHWFMPSVRPCQMTPLVSQTRQFSPRAPIDLRSSMQAMPAAPAPFRTMRTSSMRFSVRCSALISPAAQMTAVPCWSSWKTGMSISSLRRASMTKHSGARMSSRLMPPKEGPRSRTARQNSSTSSVATSRSMELTSAKRLKRTALPSITGFDASAPRLPRPRTAVPLEITATRLPLLV
jgi:hypothetical protein